MHVLHNNINETSDSELVKAYKESGNLNVLAVLYKQHTQFVFLVCMKYFKDKERSRDAVMQIFEQLIESLKQHEVQNFKGWLHTVARNHCLMALRHDKYVMQKHEDLKKEQSIFMENNLSVHHTDENTDEYIGKLNEALKELNPEQKQCIEMFYLQEKSYKEIAEQTGFDLNKVKSYIQNGKRNLKLILEKAIFLIVYWCMFSFGFLAFGF